MTPLTTMSATSWSQMKLNGPSDSRNVADEPAGEQRSDLVVGPGAQDGARAQDELSSWGYSRRARLSNASTAALCRE